MRTTEGIIREKLSIGELEWQKATKKYGMWYNENRLDAAIDSEMHHNPDEQQPIVNASFLPDKTRNSEVEMSQSLGKKGGNTFVRTGLVDGYEKNHTASKSPTIAAGHMGGRKQLRVDKTAAEGQNSSMDSRLQN